MQFRDPDGSSCQTTTVVERVKAVEALIPSAASNSASGESIPGRTTFSVYFHPEEVAVDGPVEKLKRDQAAAMFQVNTYRPMVEQKVVDKQHSHFCEGNYIDGNWVQTDPKCEDQVQFIDSDRSLAVSDRPGRCAAAGHDGHPLTRNRDGIIRPGDSRPDERGSAAYFRLALNACTGAPKHPATFDTTLTNRPRAPHTPLLADGLPPGSRSSIRKISRSSSGGMPARTEPIAATGRHSMASNTSSGVSPANGCCPAPSSYRNAPSENTSEALVAVSPRSISGGMYSSVPESVPDMVPDAPIEFVSGRTGPPDGRGRNPGSSPRRLCAA